MSPMELVGGSAGPRGPMLTEAISAAMVDLYAAFYDHDRTTAVTYINDKIVVCVLENILTCELFFLDAAPFATSAGAGP